MKIKIEQVAKQAQALSPYEIQTLQEIANSKWDIMQNKIQTLAAEVFEEVV